MNGSFAKSSSHPPVVAVFWDSSYLWGLIAYDTFRQLGVDFELLNAEDIRRGALEGREVLFVPGGWASDKIVALGDAGRDAIREFVSAGGSYLGFCGGAGLALSHESGLGLVPFGRMPTGERLPSFSGRIILNHTGDDHPMWKDVAAGTAFHAWWPGQFAIDTDTGVDVLATYANPLAGSYVTDLPIGPPYDWKKWEEAYGINLNPKRIVNEPAVVEAAFGEGKIVLSYLHFETPGDADGNRVLLNLLDYLATARCRSNGGDEGPGSESIFSAVPGGGRSGEAADIAGELANAIDAFTDLGARNFLWYRRNDWLLQWRRGVRGIEYSTLATMLGQIARLVSASEAADGALLDDLQSLQAKVIPFLDGARQLIMLERFAMNAGPISPLRADDPEIAGLRERLFSTSKRCGGEYEQIVNLADAVLLPLLRRELDSGS